MSILESAIETFRQAAELNRTDPVRKGSLLQFPNYGQVVMTGDMHGHRRNFEKLVKYCQLENTPIRHVILHELIHETPIAFGAADHSVELMLDAAKWKVTDAIYSTDVLFDLQGEIDFQVRGQANFVVIEDLTKEIGDDGKFLLLQWNDLDQAKPSLGLPS